MNSHESRSKNNMIYSSSYGLFQSLPLLNIHRSYSASPAVTKLFIDGQFVESKATEFVDVHNPATNEVRSLIKFVESGNKDNL